MRSETDMVAYALEVEPELLPWMGELLADFDELGSDAASIVALIADLGVSATTRVVDLGCGKGAVAVAIARAFGCHVEGIELFEPFLEDCRHRAAAAGVADRCRFRHGDILKLAGRTAPADIAVYAALGDVLGPLDATIGIVRRFVRPGGHILMADGYIRGDDTAAFPAFAGRGGRDGTRRQLQAHGDALVREVMALDDPAPAYARELAQLERRAATLAARHPDLDAALARYVDRQRREYAFLATDFVPVTWVLQRAA